MESTISESTILINLKNGTKSADFPCAINHVWLHDHLKTITLISGRYEIKCVKSVKDKWLITMIYHNTMHRGDIFRTAVIPTFQQLSATLSNFHTILFSSRFCYISINLETHKNGEISNCTAILQDKVVNNTLNRIDLIELVF